MINFDAYTSIGENIFCPGKLILRYSAISAKITMSSREILKVISVQGHIRYLRTEVPSIFTIYMYESILRKTCRKILWFYFLIFNFNFRVVKWEMRKVNFKIKYFLTWYLQEVLIRFTYRHFVQYQQLLIVFFSAKLSLFILKFGILASYNFKSYNTIPIQENLNTIS